MESSLQIKDFCCNAHYQECDRIDVADSGSLQLLCLQCLTDPRYSKPNRKFVDISAYFAGLAQTCSKVAIPLQNIATDTPQSIRTFLDSKESTLKKLAAHIEKEKASITEGFEMIKKSVEKTLASITEELFEKLDEEMRKAEMIMQSTTDCINLLFKGKINEVLLSQEKLFEKANSFERADELQKFANVVQKIVDEATNLSTGEDEKELMKKRDDLERALPKIEAELLKRPYSQLEAAGVEKMVDWSLVDGLHESRKIQDSVSLNSLAKFNSQLNSYLLFSLKPRPQLWDGGFGVESLNFCDLVQSFQLSGIGPSFDSYPNPQSINPINTCNLFSNNGFGVGAGSILQQSNGSLFSNSVQNPQPQSDAQDFM